MTNEEINKLVVNILGEGSEVLHPVTGGMMNLSFLVKDKNDKKYILYIPTEQANEMVDRPLEKEHQAIIHELGITSKNVYFDEKSGIKMNEYIEGSSLDHIADFDYEKVAKLFKKLHSSIVLSREDYAPFDRFVNNYEKEAKSFVLYSFIKISSTKTILESKNLEESACFIASFLTFLLTEKPYFLGFGPKATPP